MYCKIPLSWKGSDFLTANPSDIDSGWTHEYDLLRELDGLGYYPIKTWELPGNLVDPFNYTGLQVFANRLNPIFCAVACVTADNIKEAGQNAGIY